MSKLSPTKQMGILRDQKREYQKELKRLRESIESEIERRVDASKLNLEACQEQMREVLGELTEAREENKRLREALVRFVQFLAMIEAHATCSEQGSLGDGEVVAYFMGSGASDRLTVGDLRKARAALEKKEI